MRSGLSVQNATQMKPVGRGFHLIVALVDVVYLGTDREYRKAVHWLETLRLRRMKILENGYKVCHLCLTPFRSCN